MGIAPDPRRDRIAVALTEIAAERGYARTGVGDVIERAGVSRKLFYRLFDSKDDALLAGYDLLLAQTLDRMREACERETEPRARVELALQELLAVLVAHPEQARLCLLEAQAASVLSRTDPGRSVRRLAGWVDAVREELDLEPALAVGSAELVAAIVGVLQARIAGEGALDDLLPALTTLTAGAAR